MDMLIVLAVISAEHSLGSTAWSVRAALRGFAADLIHQTSGTRHWRLVNVAAYPAGVEYFGYEPVCRWLSPVRWRSICNWAFDAKPRVEALDAHVVNRPPRATSGVHELCAGRVIRA
jgi:hypothetical protein